MEEVAVAEQEVVMAEAGWQERESPLVAAQYDIRTNKTNFRAIQDIVLMEPDPELRRPTESELLFLTEGERPWARTARVLAVGPGTVCTDGTMNPTTVQVGDRVLYNQNLQQPFELGGKNVVLSRERELYAILGSEKE